MGLETVVVAFFVIGMIIVVACTLTAGANNLIKSYYEGYTAFSQTAYERLHTSIRINNVTLTDSNVHLTVENTGDTKLSNFDLWDVIVVNNNSSQVSYFKENEGFSITTSGFLNPGILDPDESIDLNLTSTFNSGNSLYVTVITENGIKASSNYIVS